MSVLVFFGRCSVCFCCCSYIYYNDDELISLFLSVHPCDGDNLSRSLCECASKLTELRFFENCGMVLKRRKSASRHITTLHLTKREKKVYTYDDIVNCIATSCKFLLVNSVVSQYIHSII